MPICVNRVSVVSKVVKLNFELIDLFRQNPFFIFRCQAQQSHLLPHPARLFRNGSVRIGVNRGGERGIKALYARPEIP